MRRLLVGWMVEVADEMKLLPNTIFRSVHLLDYALQKLSGVGKDSLQLLGSACLLVASKIEEREVSEVT